MSGFEGNGRNRIKAASLKEVPMEQFLLDVLAGVIASAIVAFLFDSFSGK